jgi:hypothetical protein
MAGSVSLHELVDELEAAGGGCYVFVNRRTGEVYGGTDESIAVAEADEDESTLPEWQRELVTKLREVRDSADWLEVPGRSEVEDYSVMERFCLEQCSGRLQEELLDSIRGRGAFGRFKDTAARRGVLDAWYTFRRAALAAELESWLRAMQIEYRP